MSSDFERTKLLGQGASSDDPAQQPRRTDPAERCLEEGVEPRIVLRARSDGDGLPPKQGPPSLDHLEQVGVADFDCASHVPGHMNHGHNGFDILHLIPLISFQGQLVLIGCRPERITSDHQLQPLGPQPWRPSSRPLYRAHSPGTQPLTAEWLTPPPGTTLSPVRGPTFQAMLLHQPVACTQCTVPALIHTRSPGRCTKRYTGMLEA